MSLLSFLSSLVCLTRMVLTCSRKWEDTCWHVRGGLARGTAVRGKLPLDPQVGNISFAWLSALIVRFKEKAERGERGRCRSVGRSFGRPSISEVCVVKEWLDWLGDGSDWNEMKSLGQSLSIEEKKSSIDDSLDQRYLNWMPATSHKSPQSPSALSLLSHWLFLFLLCRSDWRTRPERIQSFFGIETSHWLSWLSFWKARAKENKTKKVDPLMMILICHAHPLSLFSPGVVVLGWHDWVVWFAPDSSSPVLMHRDDWVRDLGLRCQKTTWPDWTGRRKELGVRGRRRRSSQTLQRLKDYLLMVL